MAKGGFASDLLRPRLPNQAAEWGAAHRPVRMVITTLIMNNIITDTFWLLVCRKRFIDGSASP
jgi:hypothetical protein